MSLPLAVSRRNRGRTSRCGVEHDFGLGDVEPAEHQGSAENSGGKVDFYAFRLEERMRRGGLPDVDGAQRHAERAGPVVETGRARLDPETIEKRRRQGAEHERLARRRGKEESAAGQDHQQQQDENDRQAHHRAESARDEVASRGSEDACTYPRRGCAMSFGLIVRRSRPLTGPFVTPAGPVIVLDPGKDRSQPLNRAFRMRIASR